MLEKGNNPSNIGKSNRALIIKHLFQRGSDSRVKIARKIGLTKASLTISVNKLMDEKILIETGTKKTTSVGRNEVLLDINKDLGYVLGISIETVVIDYTVADLKGHIIYHSEIIRNELKLDIETIFKDLNEYIDKIILSGITYVGNDITESNFVSSLIENTLNVPCYIENNVKALAKTQSFIDYQGIDTYLFIKYGPKIDSSFIYQGKLIDAGDYANSGIGNYLIKTDNGYIKLADYISYETFLKKIGYDIHIDELHDYLMKDSKVKEDFVLFLETALITIYNATKILGVEHVILYGYLFENSKIMDMMLENIMDGIILNTSVLNYKRISIAAVYTALIHGFVETGANI